MSEGTAAAPAAPAAAPSPAPAAPPAPKSPPAAAGAPSLPSTPQPPGGASNDNATPKVGADPSVADLLDLKEMGERFVEVTIDGKPERMKLGEALALARKAKTSDKRFEESARVRKQADDELGKLDKFFEALEGEDAEHLLERVLTQERLDKIAEARIARRAKLASMSPEERRKYELDHQQGLLEQERQKLEREKATTAKAERERVITEKSAQAQKAIGGEMQKALQAVGLPVSPPHMRALASAIRDHVAEGKPLTKAIVAKAAATVQREVDEIRTHALTAERARLAALEGDALLTELEGSLSAELFGKVRAADLARFQRQQAALAAPRGSDGKFQPANGNGAKPGATVKKSLEAIMQEREQERIEARRRQG